MATASTSELWTGRGRRRSHFARVDVSCTRATRRWGSSPRAGVPACEMTSGAVPARDNASRGVPRSSTSKTLETDHDGACLGRARQTDTFRTPSAIFLRTPSVARAAACAKCGARVSASPPPGKIGRPPSRQGVTPPGRVGRSPGKVRQPPGKVGQRPAWRSATPPGQSGPATAVAQGAAARRSWPTAAPAKTADSYRPGQVGRRPTKAARCLGEARPRPRGPVRGSDRAGRPAASTAARPPRPNVRHGHRPGRKPSAPRARAPVPGVVSPGRRRAARSARRLPAKEPSKRRRAMRTSFPRPTPCQRRIRASVGGAALPRRRRAGGGAASDGRDERGGRDDETAAVDCRCSMQ